MAHMQKEISFNKSYFYDFMMWACCRQKKNTAERKMFLSLWDARKIVKRNERERERKI
jgi:hypothetical protein